MRPPQPADEVLAAAIRLVQASTGEMHADACPADTASRIIRKFICTHHQLPGVASLQNSNLGLPVLPSLSLEQNSSNIHRDDISTWDLRRSGRPSQLRSCPYCAEPYRRFCPESGRRHETKEERCERLWRTLYRQTQFAGQMVSHRVVDSKNTCVEVFIVDL